MGLTTPLTPQHIELGAKIVDFAGWDMPLHYGSQVQEHHAVRRGAGVFDVSHMTIVDLRGKGVRPFLRHLLANDVQRMNKAGKALYSCMLNERGGVIDDLIVYYLDAEEYRLVVNAATRDKDLAWIQRQAEGYEVELDERVDLVMIAIQGPQARAKVLPLLDRELATPAEALAPFHCARRGDWLVARTGYTGEDGFEVMLPAGAAVGFWTGLVNAGVAPCGLGARDTLRLEAGMNLYGADMDETTTPLESGLAWTVAWEPADRNFIGRNALQAQKEAGVPRKLVGLILESRGVMRNHQTVRCTIANTATPEAASAELDAGDANGNDREGEITSGGFSPTLGRSIALARIPSYCTEPCEVEVRGNRQPVRVVRPPFVRNGKPQITL